MKGTRKATILLAVGIFAGAVGKGEESSSPAPRIIALAPSAVSEGFSGTLRLRGVSLDEATEVRTADGNQMQRWEIKEKKEAAGPSGVDPELAGDSELVIELDLGRAPAGPLALVAAVGEKTSEPVVLRVMAADRFGEESEPNNGFAEAAELKIGQSMRGSIESQHDVDVFVARGAAGETFSVSIGAGEAATLLDPRLAAYDADGNRIAAQDDVGVETRGSVLQITPASDGLIYLTVQDAHDTGSAWHGYILETESGGSSRDIDADGSETVSFSDEVWPVLRANCVSCHKPGKRKGELDLTSFAALAKGGKHGPVVVAGFPDESELIYSILGDKPDMPAEGEPLLQAEIDLLTRWVKEGAVDDTPPGGLGTRRPKESPVYRALPAVPALAYSIDGALLAAAGHHEIVVRRASDDEIVGRWPGDSRRIESLAFSRDGRFLAACGGAPSEFGEVQIWEIASGSLVRSIKASRDTLYGVSWSDDGTRLAVGGADKLVRIFEAATGNEIAQCDNHLDWVFGTAFTHDGTRIVSAGRDGAVKLIDSQTGLLIDDAARPREPVFALARHPADDVVAFSGEEERVRLHRMAPRGGRLKEGDNREESALRELEHMGTTLRAVAFSADGDQLACGGENGEVRIFQVESGQRKTTIPSSSGPVFAIVFRPGAPQLATAGSDGIVRLYDSEDGKPLRQFPAVPLVPGEGG